MTIIQIFVVDRDRNHAIYGLGDDGKPYIWSMGQWALTE